MQVNDHDQIGMDIAEHAGKKVSEAMLQALSLCETPAQMTMVAFKVLGIIAAQSAAVFVKHAGLDITAMSAADCLQMMSDIMRENYDSLERAGGNDAGA